LNILPKKHHEIIIKDFNKNKYELNLKEYSTIVEIFENQVLKNKNKIALIDGYGKSITFKELNKKSNSYANYLKNKGYSNNDIIATCLNREIDSIAFILGIFKSGLVYLPINEDLPSDKIESILLDSKAKEFIVSKNFSNKIKNTSTDILENIILLNHSKDNLNTEINKEDSVYIIYTSGSTGKPKGVEVTHDNWKGYYYSLLKEYPFNDNDRVLQFSNFNFDVFIDELTLSLLNGNSLVLKNENLLSSASSFWEFIDKNEISVLSLTPGLWHQLISTISEKEKEIINERINVCIVGGDSMNKSLLIEWQNITNRKSKIFNVYGPTETTSISSLVDVTDINFENNILTIGTPMHNEEFYILDEKMNPVPIGVKGEIYIGGIGVSKGYLNREKLNEKSFITNKYSEEKNNKFYKTGDLARWLPNGEVQFIGRNDFQVKIRGFRIELGEIEQALSKLNEIKDVVVNPITKNENKHLVAYIILKEEFKNNKNIIKKINNQLKEKLINYMIPEYYEILDTLPLTNNGKVNRKLLPEPNKINKNEKINKKTFNLNPKEVIIEREFKKILKINNINSESNYFENGGDSINALKLISNLNKEGFNITVVDLFTNPTVEDLANLISSSNKGDILKNTILEKIEYDEKLENLFCFHPLSGMSTGYTPLANELSENINTIGINCPDIYGISEHKSIEELTKTYIKYILEVNGDKPINILGYSLGGAFAYEAATQLTELGIEINNLFIIDTPPLPYKIEEDKWYSTISNLLEDEYNKKTDWEYLNSLTKKEQIKEISKIVSTSKYLPVDNLSPELLAPYISFLLNLQESFFNYNAQNTNLDINLILCKPEGNNESEEYFDLWKKKTKGSINVFETKIEHSDILKVENAQEISDIIIELKNKKRIL
jgi:amino acid adenylation domain-containing protein